MIVNYDKLTYAGNLLNLSDIAEEYGGKRYFFERGDICDYENVKKVLSKYDISRQSSTLPPKAMWTVPLSGLGIS